MICRMALAAVLLLLTANAHAQKRENYEYYKNLPKYADQLIADLNYPMAWGNSKIKNFKKWKKAARQKVFDCMLTPPPAPDSYDMKVIAEEQRDGYKAQKIEFNLSKYYRVTALMLIPDGDGPFPAVNALHDHGAHLFIGKEKMIRPFDVSEEVVKDADEWAANLYDGQYLGDYLARHGYVVFSADAPMWGERGRAEGVDRSKYDMIAGNMMMYGVDLSAYMTYDDIRGTEFLATLPQVDANRIGCVGCSMGGYRSWMLSALSDHIKAGSSICWMVTTDVQMTWKYGRSENGGFANCFPGLRRWMDYPHVASLACPKPMLFINGSQDKLFPVPGVEKAFRQMHDVWQSQHAADRLTTEIWPIPHSCPLKAQQRVLDFFNTNL
ncbi:MAG: prolyl oligopeptidase family serine peptidase [Prevotella sp.]|nr:prolyl oligopeptidase family serine peptidase [Prevotella sp.]